MDILLYYLRHTGAHAALGTARAQSLLLLVTGSGPPWPFRRSSSSRGPGGPAVQGAQGEIDVLLGVRRTMKDGMFTTSLRDPDVTLADEHAGMVDGLGQAQLEGLGHRRASLQEILNLQAQDIIQLLSCLVRTLIRTSRPNRALP